MLLFDTEERTDISPQLYSEPLYTFLNRVHSEKASYVREKLEEWFAQYPENEKTDIWRRFRSGDNDQHISAFFELYCFALLIGQGYEVEIHKQADLTQTTTPDFCVKKNGNVEFFLEATVSYESEQKKAIQNEINRMYDYLNQQVSSSFIISLRINPAADTPRISKVKSKIIKIMQECDPKEEHQIEINENGWEFIFNLYPAGKTLYGIGITWGNSGGKFLDDVDSVRSSLEIKSSKYGQLNHPYIIAVNRFTPFIFFDERDVIQVLVGKEQFQFTRKNHGYDAHAFTVPNGFWFKENCYTNKQVSGVLFGFGLCPQNMLEGNVLLYMHPDPTYPLLPDHWNGRKRSYFKTENGFSVE